MELLGSSETGGPMTAGLKGPGMRLACITEMKKQLINNHDLGREVSGRVTLILKPPS